MFKENLGAPGFAVTSGMNEEFEAASDQLDLISRPGE
jgi:hypothetical protein